MPDRRCRCSDKWKVGTRRHMRRIRLIDSRKLLGNQELFLVSVHLVLLVSLFPKPLAIGVRSNEVIRSK